MIPPMRHVVLLRGVNLGSRNRVSMPVLREALADVGYGDVVTYLQSGNVVLSSRGSPARVAETCRSVIAETFELDIAVIVRTHDELAKVVARDPLGEVVTDPKRYQVSFLEQKLPHAAVERLQAAAAPGERLVASGRELYAWHPAGVARSKLWSALAGTSLGVTATARNWTTVTKLLELAAA
jgi:uncharacterized protein (DUF1697 family)